MKAANLPFPKMSTIVRLKSGRSLRSMAMGIGSALSPNSVIRMLDRSFTHTQRSVPSVPEQEIIATGKRFTVPFEGQSIQAWSWGDGPTVLLVHGWCGRGGQLYSFVHPLVEAGYSVVTFDAPAHGETKGDRTDLPELARAVQVIANACGGVDAIVSHSVGAAATALAFRRGLQTRRAVFIAAVSDPLYLFERFCTEKGLPEELQSHARQYMESRHGISWKELNVARMGAEMKIPLAVIHDREDPDVPWVQALEIAQSWPMAEFFSTRGLGHRKILRAPEVISTVMGFLG